MNLEQKIATGREVFNLAMLVDDAAMQWGERAVLYHFETGETVTYRGIADRANQVGNALRSLGVEIENRVAILMDDCPEWVYAFSGILKVGAVVTPLNTLLTEKDYEFFLSDSRAKVIFVGSNYLDNIKSVISSLPYLRQVIVCNIAGSEEGGGKIVDGAAFLQGVSTKLETESTFSADLALFSYSSGSTGRPRAIMHSHGSLGKAVASFERLHGVGEGDIQFHIPKLYFLTSLSGLNSAFYHGSSLVLLSGRPTPSTILEAIARYRPTFLAGPPTIFARMADFARKEPHQADLSSVRYIFCSGEALSTEVFQAFKETFGKTLLNCWGSQELASAPLAWLPGEEVPLEKVGSCGKLVLPEVKIKVVDEEGKEVPDEVTGELMLKIGSHFLGYWHEPQEAARKFVEGWYKPGDSFSRDKDGYYWYRGRLDDMVKVGGRQIFPVEVEEALSHHPSVLENAVIPVKNEHGLLEIQAFVVLRGEYSPSPDLAEQIKDFVKEELSPFKRPNRVVFVSDLPKTATGKIQRFLLRDKANRT